MKTIYTILLLSSFNAFAVEVADCGAIVNDGIDDTQAIMTCSQIAVDNQQILHFPGGQYDVTGLTGLSKMHWHGDGVGLTTIRLMDNSNQTMLKSIDPDNEDVTIDGIRFDGNRANNTSGNGLVLNGVSMHLENIVVQNIAQTGIITTGYKQKNLKSGGFLGYFQNITIDQTGKHGWCHQGPSDSSFNTISIIDSGLSKNNTYFGMYLAKGDGNGRFFNFHYWNHNFTSSIPNAAMYVDSGGNNFTSSHFEGGYTPLVVAGNGNTFESSSYYAPRGAYSIIMAGSANLLNGTIGLGHASSNAHYSGIYLYGFGNIINLINGGGADKFGIDFSADHGNNIVNFTGYQPTGSAYIGIPNKTDVVNIMMTGINSRLIQ